MRAELHRARGRPQPGGYNDVLWPGRIVEQVCRDLLDPDTVVVEFTVEGRVVASGAGYRMDSGSGRATPAP